MKIAILTSGILPVPAVQGGAVENLIDFYLEYNNKYQLHDITVYSVSHPHVKRHTALQSKNNHYRYIDITSSWGRIKRYLYYKTHTTDYYNYFIEYYFEESYKDIKKQNYDCIILENRPGFAYKLSLRGYQNIILHLHNDLLNLQTPKYKEIFNSLKKILTVSDYIKGRVSTIAKDSKIQTIYNGIDLQCFSQHTNPAISRRTLGFKDNDFVMVYSGRINKEKGISELIDVMLLLKDVPHIKLMVIGSTFFGNAANEDTFVQSLKEKAKIIEHNIVFTGFIPYSQMPDYLQIADVAVIPSIWDDPFPTTVLEAQAMGLPIITSDRGGIPEEVDKRNAIIIPVKENFVTRMTDTIRYLYSHADERAAMSSFALEHSKYFNKERFACDFFKAL